MATAAIAADVSARQLAKAVAPFVTEADLDAAGTLTPLSGIDTQTTSVQPRALGIRCAKGWAAYGLFTVWGTAICGAAAASSVGALGVPCGLLLAAGSGAIDWNRFC